MYGFGSRSNYYSRVNDVPVTRYSSPDSVYVEDRYIPRRVHVPTVETLRAVEAAEDRAWRADREDADAEYLSAVYRARRRDEEEKRESVWKLYHRLQRNREKRRPTFTSVDTAMIAGTKEPGRENAYVEHLLAAYRAGRRDEAEERLILGASSPTPVYHRERTPYIPERRYGDDRIREPYVPERRYSDDVRYFRYDDDEKYL